ncbi:MAG: peptidoglycan recognition family protein [Elusimicrobiota bacterium]|nr:peptidoglycan recognition family protein [Elusimicrobiota bacterium]
MRAETLLLLAALSAAAPAAAQDMGQRVTFGSRAGLRFTAHADPFGTGAILYDSGASDPVPGAATVILFHGVSPDPGVEFHVGRVYMSGWAAWQAEVHREPGGRFWARARLPAGSGPVRLWAFDRGITRDHEVEIYGVELVEDMGEAPEASTARPPARPPVPDAPMPPVHGRAAWGARPATEPYTPHESVWRVTVHHTDGRYTATLQESLDEARFIQEFHQNGRKWIDIAYHYLIDEAGRVIEGRPEGVQGAHTLSNNAGNIGVTLMGKYHAAQDHEPTPAQFAALAELVRSIALRYGIDPLVEVKGHRNYKATDCPGDHAYARLPELRRLADGGAPPAPPAFVRLPRVSPELPFLLAPASWDGQRQAASSAAPNASR